MNDVLTHELVHAYDFARVKYDVNNLRHLACTEVSNQVCLFLLFCCVSRNILICNLEIELISSLDNRIMIYLGENRCNKKMYYIFRYELLILVVTVSFGRNFSQGLILAGKVTKR